MMMATARTATTLDHQPWHHPHQSPPPPVRSSRRRRKHVTFATEPPSFLNTDNDNISDKSALLPPLCHDELWYSSVEIKGMKRATIVLAKEIVSRDKRLEQEAAATAASSYLSVVQHVLDVCENDPLAHMASSSLLPRRVQDQFVTCVQHAPTRLGMEKLTLKELGLRSMQRRAQLYAQVKALQQTRTNNNNDETAAELRKACERITQPARSFAYELGVACQPQRQQQVLQDTQNNNMNKRFVSC